MNWTFPLEIYLNDLGFDWTVYALCINPIISTCTTRIFQIQCRASLTSINSTDICQRHDQQVEKNILKPLYKKSGPISE